MRTMRYTTRSASEAAVWQRDLRAKLLCLLRVDDLVAGGRKLPLNATPVREERGDAYTIREIEINATPGRRIPVLVTTPSGPADSWPAVVCIHGHQSDRYGVHDKASIYKGFAAELAVRGYITIAADVGGHQVGEPGRTLMGERLWDLMRCVDYLAGSRGVDTRRIGCAGLSLGGEMAMWLAALDERVAVTVSSGFLTRMDQMEQKHCMCWKFEGLRDLADFADIYSLVAPRALLCQNGLREQPHAFIPSLAREALAEIRTIYEDFGRPDNVALVVHEGEHEMDIPSLLDFFETRLQRRNAG